MNKLLYLLFALCVSVAIVSCGNKEDHQNWEYKTLTMSGQSFDKFTHRDLPLNDEELNTMGAEGWELVSVYTNIETVHPNFGDSRYVTGLQSNTRTAEVYYVFKRPKIEDPSTKKNKTNVKM